jgi:hypothetical protein
MRDVCRKHGADAQLMWPGSGVEEVTGKSCKKGQEIYHISIYFQENSWKYLK